MRRKLFSLFALLLMAVTSAWADVSMLETPLTLEAKSAGTIKVSKPKVGMKYKKNSDATVIVESTDDITIDVVANDKVEFFGNGTSIISYFTDAENYTNITGGTAECYIYGNIMSLVNETGFSTATALTGENAFRNLFRGNANLYNHDTNDLVLPATTLAAYCYTSMFYGCTGLTKAPALPAPILAAYCYTSMFSGCTSLSAAPALPAETLASNCYRNMFRNCTILNSVPETLPATTLADSCYFSMFNGCTSLSSVPTLLATTLAPDCYRSMFMDCNLTTIPGDLLKVTTLAPRCYQDMFKGTKFTSVPVTLPATTLAEECYYAMFNSCTELTTIPEDLLQSATTLAKACYRSMFMNCTGLTTVPAALLPATELAEDCYMNMFYGTSLTTAPALPATTLAAGCYYRMFYVCSNLTTAPVLPATTLADSCYYQMFYNNTILNAVTCLATDISAPKSKNGWLYGVAGTGTFVKAEGMTSWTSGVSGIPASWTVYDYTPLTLEAKTAGTIVVSNPKSGMKYSMDGGITKTAVTSDPIEVAVGDKVRFYGNGTSITCYDGTQIGGTAQCYIYGFIMSLVDENEFITAKTLTGANAFRNLFSGNANLYNHDTKELRLSATTLTEGCYQGMFSGCTNLTTAPALPATTLANACYQGMFSGCTGLTATPELLAAILEENCYKEMFSGCTSLNAVTCYATNISATGATTNWLNGVAASGTFTKAEETEWVTESPSGIPAGWTPAVDPLAIPLTLKVKEDVDGTKTIVISKPQIGMKYKKNNEAIVTASTTDDITIYVAANDIVKFFGNGTSITTYNNKNDVISDDTRFSGTADCYIYGNIMSLVDEENYASATTLPADSVFCGLFRDNTHLYNHATKELLLPATTLSAGCYRAMFRGCSNLTTVPALPATAMEDYCYYYMFYGCTGLTAVPADLLPAKTMKAYCYASMLRGTGLTSLPAGLLPAKTLANYCYQSMFNSCTGLTTVPADLLPAKTLGVNCYQNMFSGCTNLTTAPELPATALPANCYKGMFQGCTNLTTAPVLPATTLGVYCYVDMFKGCSNLNSVTCLATTQIINQNTSNWLNGVAAEGTFTKASKANWGSRGVNKIPTGWTIANKAILNDANDIASQLTAGQTCTVEYSREFTESKPSTVCLPFAYEVKDGEEFYTFGGVHKDGEGNFVADMIEYSGDNLVANTPYLYVPASTGATDFSGTYTLPAEIAAGTTGDDDGWKFVGTYTTQEWDDTPHPGIYGFSAQATGNIKQGEFVKVGAYVRVKPMRSYLMYKNGEEDYHAVRGFSGFEGGMMTSAASESLPERIKVRFVDANGEVTGIGTLNTQTGDVNFDSESWYTLDGIRLTEKPTQKGIYVNNGKKVMIK